MARWCRDWSLARGAVLSLDQAWALAKAWYAADRRAPEWRRPSADEAEATFASVGLTAAFWSLRQ